MNTKSDQQIVKQDVMTMRYKYGLATRRNHPVAQRKMGTAINAISLVTVTNHPVVKQISLTAPEYGSLVTESNQPVVKPGWHLVCRMGVWLPCRISQLSNSPT